MAMDFTYITKKKFGRQIVNSAGRSVLLAACQPFLADFFRFALAALGAAVEKVVGNAVPEENFAAIWTFHGPESTFFAALFASHWRRSPRHWVETLFHGLEVFFLTYFIDRFAVRIIAFHPGHFIIGYVIDASAAAGPSQKSYHARHNQAHDNNADHNRFLPAVFHADISKLLNNNMVTN
jgi:hypothetical protein